MNARQINWLNDTAHTTIQIVEDLLEGSLARGLAGMSLYVVRLCVCCYRKLACYI